MKTILTVVYVIAGLVLLTPVMQAQANVGSCKPVKFTCGARICVPGDNTVETIVAAQGTSCTNPIGKGFCDGADVKPSDCIIPEPGTIFPAYYIAGVVYAPPGNGSNLDYGTGTTIGTTTSTTNSWNNSFKAEVSTGLNIGVVSVGATVNFGNDFGGSNSTQVDVAATMDEDFIVDAVPGDSVNHNYDQVLLFLGPKINVVIDPSGAVGTMDWGLDLSQAKPQIVLVGWLNGAIQMPSDVAGELAVYGIGAKDYPQILGVDPFAADQTGARAPSAARFEYATSFPYEPTVSDVFKYKLSNSYTSSTTETSSVSYTVGATASASALGNSLRVSDEFTWGNSSSQNTSSGTSATQTLSLAMPSPAYTGPTVLYVYIDKIYKTFLFSFTPPLGN